MKTQISNLRSGTKRQLLNEKVDYSKLPKSTSHPGHAGTNHATCLEVWEKVVRENPEKMRIKFLGEEIILKRNSSISGKHISFYGGMSNETTKKCVFELPKKVIEGLAHGDIHIQGASNIEVSNGGNDGKNVCPSLIEIL